MAIFIFYYGIIHNIREPDANKHYNKEKINNHCSYLVHIIF